jgi:hypothetical protein
MTRLIVELFKRRLQIAKNVCIDFDDVLPFYRPSSTDGATEEEPEITDSKTSFALPSKSSAEKLVNSFFNTWHHLFPILHRPSFLWDFEAMYTEKASKDPAHFAQMWLVLAIAARDAVTKVPLSNTGLTAGKRCSRRPRQILPTSTLLPPPTAPQTIRPWIKSTHPRTTLRIRRRELRVIMGIQDHGSRLGL